MSIALPEAVERAVAAALDGLNGQIEQLLADALDRQLEALAAALLAERIGTVIDDPAESSTKVCKACGESKPNDQFERQRGVCRPCRRQQVRDRARTAPEGDRPAADAQRG